MAIIDNVQKLVRIAAQSGTVVVARIDNQFDNPQIKWEKRENTAMSSEELAYDTLLEDLAVTYNAIENGEKISSVGYVLPTNVAVRLLEVQKVVRNNPTKMSLDALKARIVKGWIKKQNPALAGFIEETVEAFQALSTMDGGPRNIVIMKAVNLRNWELDTAACDLAGIEDGQELTFKESFDEEHGVMVQGHRHFNGTAKVSKRAFKRRDGSDSGQYLIPRVPGKSEIGLKNALAMDKIASDNMPRAKEAVAEDAVAL